MTLPFALDRPLVSLDVETHDKVSPEQARIVELGFKVIYHDGREPKKYRNFINPGVPISAATTAIHGIKDEDVRLSPSFSAIAANLAKGFTNVDFTGYNVRFDLRVLAGEMKRANVEWSYTSAYLLDGLRLWQIARPRTLEDALREHCNREPRQAHRALEDAEDALDVVIALLEKYPAILPKDLRKLHEMSFPRDPNAIDPDGKLTWIGDKPCINFGKHRGTSLDRLTKNYIEWMLGADFGPEVKSVLRGVLDGKLPVKGQDATDV